MPNDPTNHHESFQHAMSSLARFLGNIPEGHPSKYYSKLSMLNYGVLMEWDTVKNMHLVYIGSIKQCDLVCLEDIRSHSLSCLVHRRPFLVLVSLGRYSQSLRSYVSSKFQDLPSLIIGDTFDFLTGYTHNLLEYSTTNKRKHLDRSRYLNGDFYTS